MERAKFVTLAIYCVLMLAGCGEVDSTYTTSRRMSARENSAASALVDSTAHRLALRLDPEGLSPTWHSFDKGALSIELGDEAGRTWVFFADDRLRHKRAFDDSKAGLTRGLRRIDSRIQIETRWSPNPMM